MVDDARLGESVAAFVIPRRDWVVADANATEQQQQQQEAGPQVLTKDAVRAWVRTKLSSHLVPKHVFWVDEYPKTASGKIQKFKLRDMAVEALRNAAGSVKA